MPLDGHTHLVNQGWGGKGTGLRHGAISRPLAIPQKKNLAGLGKDRDEAFPFWDHLFSAAAKSIQLKCLSDDEEDSEQSSNNVEIKRTSTGIFSTRRPLEGTPATSGSSTPIPDSGCHNARLSLLTTAKRDAAKRGLYARFFRGPVLGPETLAEEEKRLASLVSGTFANNGPDVERVTVEQHIEIQTLDERVTVDLDASKSSKPKRKAKDQVVAADVEDTDAKRERKRRKREEKQAVLKEDRNDKKRKDKQEELSCTPSAKEVSTSRKAKKPRDACDHEPLQADGLATGDDDSLERKRRKGEKRGLKEEKRRLKALRESEDNTNLERPPTSKAGPIRKTSESTSITPELVEDGGKKKKKRKHRDGPSEA